MFLSAMARPESAALVLFEIPLLLLLFYSLSLSFPLYNLCHNSIFSAAVTFYYLQQSSSSNAGYWAMNQTNLLIDQFRIRVLHLTLQYKQLEIAMTNIIKIGNQCALMQVLQLHFQFVGQAIARCRSATPHPMNRAGRQYTSCYLTILSVLWHHHFKLNGRMGAGHPL